MEKLVLEIPNVIPSDTCDAIVQRFENDNRKSEGRFSYKVEEQIVTREKYNTELSITDYSDWEDINQFFLDKTLEVYKTYLKHLNDTFIEYGDSRYPIYERELQHKHILCTGFPLQRIGKGGLYDWHHDGDLFKPYFVQIIFYLNTLQENQGGCTEFIDGKKVRPEKGKVMVYPCSWTVPHKGGEVEHGYKYICTTTVSIQTTQLQVMPGDR